MENDLTVVENEMTQDPTNQHFPHESFEKDSYFWLLSCVSSQRHLNFTSSINLSSHPLPFLCTPPSLLPLTSSLPNSPPSAQLFIFSYYNSGNRVLSAWQSIPSEAGFTPLAALPLLLTRFPKGRKAHLWPSAWWAPTAVCSGITPAEKGGIPAPAAFVTARPLFAFDKTAVQSPPGPHGWREGKEPRGDFRLMVVSVDVRCHLHLRSLSNPSLCISYDHIAFTWLHLSHKSKYNFVKQGLSLKL